MLPGYCKFQDVQVQPSRESEMPVIVVLELNIVREREKVENKKENNSNSGKMCKTKEVKKKKKKKKGAEDKCKMWAPRFHDGPRNDVGLEKADKNMLHGMDIDPPTQQSQDASFFPLESKPLSSSLYFPSSHCIAQAPHPPHYPLARALSKATKIQLTSKTF